MKIANRLSFSGRLFVGTIRVVVISAFIVFGFASATPSRAASQSQEPAASTPVYEVASIKPTKSTSGGFRIWFTPNGLTAENVDLMMLIQSAYGIGRDRISGAPDWFNSERYDIDAKMDTSVADALKKLSVDDRRVANQHMLRVLLAERFKLTLHRENKELPVLNLVIAKNGPKLQESTPDEKTAKVGKASDSAGDIKTKSAASPGGPSVVVGVGTGGGKSVAAAPGGGASISFGGRGGTQTMSGKAVTLEALTVALASATGRPVLDKTGLTGKYDYKLEYAPQDDSPDADPTGPSIFTAVQEQLGLKLESAKGPVEIIVIDHVEKASDN